MGARSKAGNSALSLSLLAGLPPSFSLSCGGERINVEDELGLGVGMAGPLDLDDALEGHVAVADAEEDRVLGSWGSGGPLARSCVGGKGGAAGRVLRVGGSPNPVRLRNEQRRRRRLRWCGEREEIACVGETARGGE